MARFCHERASAPRFLLQGGMIQILNPFPAFLIHCWVSHVLGSHVSYRVYASAMTAQEVAAAEMNWSRPCGKPVSKYGCNPKARERTSHVPSSSCVRKRYATPLL